MRNNFGFNKRKIEETKKKRQEEKRNKKLNKKAEESTQGIPPAEPGPSLENNTA